MTKKRSGAALRAVDFFCGAGGLSYGFTRAGIQVLAGIDNSADCKKTYEANVLGAKFIKHNICSLGAKDLERRLGIEPDDPNLIFAGCSPCQFWSKIRTNKEKALQTAFLLKQFKRFINYFRPGYVVVENVPGLYRRKSESILGEFVNFLEKSGYQWKDGLVNANNYGVPQNRIRYLLIATRGPGEVSLPEPDRESKPTVSDFIGLANGFLPISAGHRDSSRFMHTAAILSEANLKRIAMTPVSGGSRAAWRGIQDLQIPAYKGKDRIFSDVYGRMYWDRPAPTITTRFNSLSNGRFGHPEENRAISIREGATLQTFPSAYSFFGPSNSSITRQIGNAVPPELARRIGHHLIALSSHG